MDACRSFRHLFIASEVHLEAGLMCEKISESAGEPLSACVKMLINEKRKRKESEINDIERAGVIGIINFYTEMNTNINFWHGRLGLT